MLLPYAKSDPAPMASDPVVSVGVDDELGAEAFTYSLKSGRVGSIHVEQVLEYNEDPAYMRDLLLYSLTVEAERRVAESPLTRREIIRRLGTSPAQFYRLLDPTNYRKSIDKVIELLRVVDCDVDFIVKPRSEAVDAVCADVGDADGEFVRAAARHALERIDR